VVSEEHRAGHTPQVAVNRWARGRAPDGIPQRAAPRGHRRAAHRPSRSERPCAAAPRVWL